MSSPRYEPGPLDTSRVVLSPPLETLVEELARNSHEVWAAQRLSEGWSNGPRRDDSLRLHPCLIPYEELPESEKEIDRATVRGTVEGLLALGYQVLPPTSENNPPPATTPTISPSEKGEETTRQNAVVVFTGHRTDAPDAPSPRFPESEAAAVKETIARQLDVWSATVGFAAAASGGDLLFLEAMLERGGEIHLILPHDAASFRESSVLEGADASWGKRFDAVCQQATRRICLTRNSNQEDGNVYAFGNQVMFGLARLYSREADLPLRPLAVWNREHPGRQGGSGDCVRSWEAEGADVTVISPLPGGPGSLPDPPAELSSHARVQTFLLRQPEGPADLAPEILRFDSVEAAAHRALLFEKEDAAEQRILLHAAPAGTSDPDPRALSWGRSVSEPGMFATCQFAGLAAFERQKIFDFAPLPSTIDSAPLFRLISLTSSPEE